MLETPFQLQNVRNGLDRVACVQLFDICCTFFYVIHIYVVFFSLHPSNMGFVKILNASHCDIITSNSHFRAEIIKLLTQIR